MSSPGPTPPSGNGKDRISQFKKHVDALNAQFLDWCTTQVSAKGDRFLTYGVADYLRHSAKLRLEYADVLTADDGISRSETDLAAGGRAYAPLLSLMPLARTKVVHFIRHGEGWHNVGLANSDAHLTPKGWQQAHALGRHMQQHAATRDVQVVLVSPLMRTLETAAGVFGAEEGAGGGAGVLMVAQTEVYNERTAHAEVQARPGLKYVANELTRERLGPSPCDRRRPRTQAAAAFPAVDFGLIETDEDAFWVSGKVEPESVVGHRGRQFLQYLMSDREETNVAVVTHSALLWFTLLGFSNDCARPVRDSIQRWYENCEMRSVVLSDGGAISPVPDVTWFKGGAAFAEPQQGLLDEGNGKRVAWGKTEWAKTP